MWDHAPPPLDDYIQPADAALLARALRDVWVSRPELDGEGDAVDAVDAVGGRGAASAGAGDPRTVTIRLTFAPNEFFEDATLSKTLWERRAADGWVGWVSEPVRIRWRPGKDLSCGLTDAACALFEARRRRDGDGVGDGGGKDLPEHAALRHLLRHHNARNTSLFTWFGWVSARRWVGAAEHARAQARHAAGPGRPEGAPGDAPPPADKDAGDGEDVEGDAEEEEDGQAVEVHEAGAEVALAIVQELWPDAIKLFTEAMEEEGEGDGDGEGLDLDLDEEDEDVEVWSEEEEEGDEDDVPDLVRAEAETPPAQPAASASTAETRPRKKQKV